MYDIKNLNIWKECDQNNIFLCRRKVLTADGSRREENIMTDKCKEVFYEIQVIMPEVDLGNIKKRRGGKFRFPIYINESLKTADLELLDLSVRSGNCLHRAGYRTIGELVEAIEGGEDLKKIRNCGDKSIDEIMGNLFCFQYSLISQENKLKYINRIVQLNQ